MPLFPIVLKFYWFSLKKRMVMVEKKKEGQTILDLGTRHRKTDTSVCEFMLNILLWRWRKSEKSLMVSSEQRELWEDDSQGKEEIGK